MHLDGPESGHDVRHGRHEREPDVDEHEDSKAVKVLAVGDAWTGEGHLFFTRHTGAVKVVCSVGTLHKRKKDWFRPVTRTV